MSPSSSGSTSRYEASGAGPRQRTKKDRRVSSWSSRRRLRTPSRTVAKNHNVPSCGDLAALALGRVGANRRENSLLGTDHRPSIGSQACRLTTALPQKATRRDGASTYHERRA